MENLVDVARRVLHRQPHPALPYTELHRLVSLERPGPRPDPEFLLRRIRTRTDLFRTVEPWRGPWRLLTGDDTPALRAYRSALAEAGLPVDLWIVPRTSTDRPAPGLRDPRWRLHATLLALSRGLDADSAKALTRWMLLLRQGRTARERLDRTAA